MSKNTSKIVLWLFVINLGIAFGAGLYEHTIVVSRWISTSPEYGTHWNAAAARDDVGPVCEQSQLENPASFAVRSA